MKRKQLAGRFLAGAGIGLVAAFGIQLGVIGAALAISAVVLIGLTLPRFAALAGALSGLGATWLVLFGYWSLACARPEQPCGATPPNLTPWIAGALMLIVAGVLVAVVTVVRPNNGA